MIWGPRTLVVTIYDSPDGGGVFAKDGLFASRQVDSAPRRQLVHRILYKTHRGDFPSPRITSISFGGLSTSGPANPCRR